jgi:acid stress chaperone HdeB
MKFRFLATLAVAALLPAVVASPALAAGPNEFDIAAITCKDLITAKKDDAGTIMIWLHGFFAGKTDDTTMNLDEFGKSSEAMGSYCAEHPDIGVMSAAKTVFAQ